jgi:hypothetical protein
MTMNINNLRNVKECNREALIANGNFIKGKYVGDLVCKTGDDIPKILLRNVLAPLNLSCDLLSVTQSPTVASQLHSELIEQYFKLRIERSPMPKKGQKVPIHDEHPFGTD